MDTEDQSKSAKTKPVQAGEPIKPSPFALPFNKSSPKNITLKKNPRTILVLVVIVLALAGLVFFAYAMFAKENNNQDSAQPVGSSSEAPATQEATDAANALIISEAANSQFAALEAELATADHIEEKLSIYLSLVNIGVPANISSASDYAVKALAVLQPGGGFEDEDLALLELDSLKLALNLVAESKFSEAESLLPLFPPVPAQE